MYSFTGASGSDVPSASVQLCFTEDLTLNSNVASQVVEPNFDFHWPRNFLLTCREETVLPVAGLGVQSSAFEDVDHDWKHTAHYVLEEVLSFLARGFRIHPQHRF